MSRRQALVHEWLGRLRGAAAALGRPAAFMEVCGTHTVNAFRCGLHSLMPGNVSLLSGPGCPVCVTSQGDIDLMIAAGRIPGAILCTYGDMIRVPGSEGSLQDARAAGADVRVVYSAADAVKIARANPQREVVLVAVGFETTTPPSAITVLQARRLGLGNFSAVVSHKRIIPAMRALLEGGKVQLAGFLCPGHVSVIIGSDVYRPIVERYGMPCVIAGFEDVQIAEGMARLTEQAREGVAKLENAYSQAVTPQGNRVAQAVIDEVFEPADAVWRGLGSLPDSGLAFRARFREFDAAHRFGLERREVPEPAGCRCGEVITGRATPADCALFGNVCNPVNPIGPCMVSSEGTCQAWFKYGGETRRQEPVEACRD